MSFWSALFLVCSVGFFSLQEPGSDLVAALDGPQPEDRLRAAEEIAAMGPGVEAWLEKRVGKGSALAQRGVLLAAALLGTPQAHKLLSDVARAGRRPDPQRAWALLLYGSAHPDAGKDPESDWKRARSDFEGACLLAGYLGHVSVPDIVALRKVIGRRPTVRQEAFLALLAARAGQAVQSEGDAPALRAARLMVSVVPGQKALSTAEFDELRALMPTIWVAAAKRVPGRNLDSLRGTPLRGEEASSVLALREVSADQRAQAFAFLAERVTEEPSASWLWGLAGELGLQFPPASAESIPSYEAAGVLRLAQLDLKGARAVAKSRLDVARSSLAARESIDLSAAPAVLLLALAGERGDYAWFQAQLSAGAAETRAWLQPLWLLAAGKFGDARARESLLADWAFRLGAGTGGYLDHAGRLFVALVLLAGTEAAQESLELASHSDAFELDHDHAITDEFYLDLWTLLASEHYRWRFDI
ncbi:MAG: hypothetical protein MK209_02360 [Planctomycetes bacterium]|nr:hypothetical protein [Planctomycetota bacterium]